MTPGIAISTYFPIQCSSERLSIFRTSIQSLLSSEFPGKIFIVDDGSGVMDHIDILKAEDFENRIKIIYKPENSGVAKTKNTCIKLLLNNDCQVGFLADDDLKYSTGWQDIYAHSMAETRIPHFSLFVDKGEEIVEYNGHRVKKTPHVNGCFLTFTKKLIDSIGYFRILPYKYGHEHSNFTIRSTLFKQIPFFCDVIGSEDYINLIPESVQFKSLLEIDELGFRNNERIATKEFIVEPFID